MVMVAEKGGIHTFMSTTKYYITKNSAIESLEVSKAEFDKCLEKLVTDCYDEEDFDEELEETIPWINLLGCEYSPAKALRYLDWDAYRQEFLAFQDNKLKEKKEELDNKGTCTIWGTIFEIRDDDDDEDGDNE